jgi:hypothetical protein
LIHLNNVPAAVLWKERKETPKALVRNVSLPKVLSKLFN